MDSGRHRKTRQSALTTPAGAIIIIDNWIHQNNDGDLNFGRDTTIMMVLAGFRETHHLSGHKPIVFAGFWETHDLPGYKLMVLAGFRETPGDFIISVDQSCWSNHNHRQLSLLQKVSPTEIAARTILPTGPAAWSTIGTTAGTTPKSGIDARTTSSTRPLLG